PGRQGRARRTPGPPADRRRSARRAPPAAPAGCLGVADDLVRGRGHPVPGVGGPDALTGAGGGRLGGRLPAVVGGGAGGWAGGFRPSWVPRRGRPLLPRVPGPYVGDIALRGGTPTIGSGTGIGKVDRMWGR